MGIAGRSYEAEQGLLYYSLLAVPNRWLKAHASPTRQIHSLRLVSLSFVFVSVLFLLFEARRMATAGSALAHPLYLTALLLSIANINTYATLGNDALSALCGAIGLCLTLRAAEKPDESAHLAGLCVLVVLSTLLVKASNLLLLLLPLGIAVSRVHEHRSRRTLRATATALSPLLILLAYFLDRILRTGSAFTSVAAREYFAAWLPRVPTTWEFVRTLMGEVFNISHVGVWAPPLVGTVSVVLVAVAIVLYPFRFESSPEGYVVGIALLSTAMLLAASSALNRWSAGVHWHAFRHYVALTPLLVIAITSPLFRGPRNLVASVLLVASAGGSLVVFRLARQVLQ